jgi:hypothetical protein
MSEFKWTKGKWKAVGLEVWKAEGNPLIIGKAHQHNLNNMGLQEQQANALLISKAPEMLEMLVYFIGILQHTEGYQEDIKQAKQLIKEATEL